MEGGGFAWTLPQVLPARTSLTHKPRSKYWLACFRNVNGKQRRRSTGQTDRKKPAQGWEISGETLPVATVRKFVADWLQTKEPEVSAGTLQRGSQGHKNDLPGSKA
jgi:hypothetical protein